MNANKKPSAQRGRLDLIVIFFGVAIAVLTPFDSVDASFIVSSPRASKLRCSAFTSHSQFNGKSPTKLASPFVQHRYLYRRRSGRQELLLTSTDAPPSASTIISPHIEFHSPLLEDGYPPAVVEAETGALRSKPLLLYLPGFDGTMLAPFLQYPSLGEEFDVRAMTVGMEDRSTVEELRDTTLEYLRRESESGRSVYLVGESFGGILASEVALLAVENESDIDLRGLVLVNPATSYLRSELAREGPPVSDLPPYLYALGLTAKLVPLFLDEGIALRQLGCILSSGGLPSVVNTVQREAYMGRVAFDLASRLKFMPQDTLKWRLERWLTQGAEGLEAKMKGAEMKEGMRSLRTLIVVGELDLTLPSMDEARRLTSDVFVSSQQSDDDDCGVNIHVVKGAGHASTCGGSLHLVETMRGFFPGLTSSSAKNEASENIPVDDELFGLVPRYDNAAVGLLPIFYWSKENYRVWNDK